MTHPDAPAASPRRPQWVRYAPAAAAAVALLAFFAFGGADLVSLDSVRANHQAITAFVAAHPAASVGGFIVCYAALVAIGFPSTIVLTVIGGVAFGLAGAAASLVAITLGALAMFSLTRGPLQDVRVRRFGPTIERLRRSFHGDAFAYLLALRLFPFAPFLVVTLAGAASGMGWRPFAVATFLGTAPPTVLYTSLGSGAVAFLDRVNEAGLREAAVQPSVTLPLIGLAALAVAPAAWRRWRAKSAPSP